ncbi:hypothetical protein OIU76_013410 [Salix suchowensis]|nr:hypothetical protein OIU76_013410 [Salix suchowensis]
MDIVANQQQQGTPIHWDHTVYQQPQLVFQLLPMTCFTLKSPLRSQKDLVSMWFHPRMLKLTVQIMDFYEGIESCWRPGKKQNPPKAPEEAARLVIQTLKRHQKADVEGLLAFYCLPLVQVSAGIPTSLPDGVKFEMQTLPVDAKAIPDGDTITVYVSTTSPRESSCVPGEVQIATVQRSKARAERNYGRADALHKKVIEAGYRVINIQNDEILARKYRIQLRGIDAPESAMPYGKEAREELANLVQGKCLRIFVYGEDRYGRCVGDIYSNGIFVQVVSPFS